MLNPVEEAKYAELRNMCRELHVPSVPEIHIRRQVHDKNGVLAFDDIQRGHSWNRNYWNLLFRVVTGAPGTSAVFGAGYLSSKNYVAALSVAAYSETLGYPGSTYWGGGLGQGTAGIVIGTGIGAESVESYDLGTRILHGTTTGKMSYALQNDHIAAYTAGTKIWKMTATRIFNNNSGGTIVVGETGIIGNNCLQERNLLSIADIVPNGYQYTVTYEISMDFSAID